MRLNVESTPVETFGVTATSDFKIAMNAKAFRALSDTMYQNKIGSIVRELSCNAFDSHVVAGKPDEPFIVHVPSALEPWFAVVDNGIGLSPEAVETIYKTYFESTKDQSNESVGAFGLGSKTPFCYTDAFTLISRYNGVRRAYSAFITESGTPTCALLDESPTDESNGVEVQMPVKDSDYVEFRREIANQLKFFKVKPTLHNSTGITFDDRYSNMIVDTPDIGVRAGYPELWIVQGPVGYKVEHHALRSKLSSASAKLLDLLHGHQCYMYFNIGEIEVTLSREGVQYTAYTVKNIEIKLQTVAKEMEKYVTDRLAKYDSIMEKVEYVNSSEIVSKFATAANIDLSPARSFRGKYWFDYKPALRKEVEDDDGHTHIVPRCNINRYIRNTRSAVLMSLQGTNEYTLASNSEDFAIVFRDTGNRPIVRLRNWFIENNMKEIIVLNNVDAAEIASITADIKALVPGFTRFFKISEMEVPPTEKRERAAYTPYTCLRWENNDIADISGWEREYDKLADIEDGGAYLLVDRHTPVGVEYDTLRKFATLSSAGVTDLPLYAVRESHFDKIKGNPNWINVNDIVTAGLESVKGDLSAQRYHICNAVMETINRSFTNWLEVFAEIKDNIDKDSPIFRMLRIRDIAKRVVERELSPKAKVAVQIEKPDDSVLAPYTDSIKEVCKLVTEQYPLMWTLRYWEVSSQKKDILNYINAMHLMERASQAA